MAVHLRAHVVDVGLQQHQPVLVRPDLLPEPQRHDVRDRRGVAGAQPVADAHDVQRRPAEGGKRRQQRCTGGGHRLPFQPRRAHRRSGHGGQLQRGRGRGRDCAVLRDYDTTPKRQRRGIQLRHAQGLQPCHHSHHVHERVQRAKLVQMRRSLLRGDAMRPSLRLLQASEDLPCLPFADADSVLRWIASTKSSHVCPESSSITTRTCVPVTPPRCPQDTSRAKPPTGSLLSSSSSRFCERPASRSAPRSMSPLTPPTRSR